MIQAWSPTYLPRVIDLLEKYDAFDESRRVLQDYLNTARNSLTPLPLTQGRIALSGLADYLADQVQILEPVSRT
jgi:geranylgeranyl pyrophosphate synthase